MAAMARPDRVMLTPADGEGDAAHRVEAQGADQDDGGDDQVAGLLVKSTWFSTTLRTPMAEIMP